MAWTIPERIETERLVVRAYVPEDADTMSAVIPANREHLQRFLPWAANEPVTDAERRTTVETFIREFDEGSNFTYGIFEAEGGAYVGGTGLHTRLGPGALEIGYWIAADREGLGYVSETVQALTLVALEVVGARRVEIHHVPENRRSGAVPLRCGYRYRGREDTLMPGAETPAPTDIWVADRATLAVAPLALAPRPRIVLHGAEVPWPG